MAIDQVDRPVETQTPAVAAAEEVLTAETRRATLTMKAIVQDAYGAPGKRLELRDIAKPHVKDEDPPTPCWACSGGLLRGSTAGSRRIQPPLAGKSATILAVPPSVAGRTS